MPLRPYLLLYRNRLIYAAVLSLVSALLMLFWTTAEYPTDFGILWHHFCGCPPDPADTFVLLNISGFTCACIGMLFGIGVGTGFNGNAAHPGAAAFHGQTRYLFTRPSPKTSVLLVPALIAIAAIILLPAAGLLLLIGWLRLVHAPALGHLLNLVRLIPSATAALSVPRPTLHSVLNASHFLWYYVSSVSLGLCAYALFNAQRWTVLSKHRWVRLSSAFPLIVILVPALHVLPKGVGNFVFLVPLHKQIASPPPASWVVAHFLFAALVLYGCWTIAREAEV